MTSTPPDSLFSDGFGDEASADLGPAESGPGAVAALAREVRSIERVRMLAEARYACGELIQRITDGTASRLPKDQQDLFETVSDPYLALSRTVTALGRLIVLEDRLDQNAEARAARHAAEAAEREQAHEAELARQERQRREAALATKKGNIRRAVTLAHRDAYPDMRPIDRIGKIDDLFDDLDDLDAIDDWDRDPVAVVADLCLQLGLRAPLPTGGGGAKTKPDQARPDQAGQRDLAQRARAHLLDTARSYLDWAAESDPADDTEADPADPGDPADSADAGEPAALAQGPPLPN